MQQVLPQGFNKTYLKRSSKISNAHFEDIRTSKLTHLDQVQKPDPLSLALLFYFGFSPRLLPTLSQSQSTV